MTQPLGISDLISQVFTIFRTRFQVIFLVALLYSVVSIGLSVALIGPAATFGLQDPVAVEALDPETFDPETFDPQAMGIDPPGVGDFLNGLLQILLSALFVAAMARLVVDAQAGRQDTAQVYLRAAMASALTVAALTIAISVMGGLGIVLLILPGIWVLAVFSVAIPAAVIEGRGFDALARSAALTKGYRWPIVGFGLVFLLIVVLLSLLVGTILVPLTGLAGAGGEVSALGGLVVALVTAAVSAAYAGLGAIPAPVLYLRLRALKGEGAPTG
jgi:hypothetical protein